MKVHIILGSKSDSPVAEKATKTLDDFKVDYEITIASAHRTPEYVQKIVTKSTADLFIGVAGLAAALPGTIAAHTTKPVIGIPVSGKVNLDAILSIIQMPPGVPVAAVGLDRGDNAALLAIEILAISNKTLKKRLEDYRTNMKKEIIASNKGA
jgi:5-(carboxyamino)imidazole ribonucleotide mutase